MQAQVYHARWTKNYPSERELSISVTKSAGTQTSLIKEIMWSTTLQSEFKQIADKQLFWYEVEDLRQCLCPLSMCSYACDSVTNSLLKLSSSNICLTLEKALRLSSEILKILSSESLCSYHFWCNITNWLQIIDKMECSFCWKCCNLWLLKMVKLNYIG